MKNGILMILMSGVVFVSCKKTNNSNARVLFYNGTWSLPAITVAWNGNSIIGTALAPGQSSGTAGQAYLQIPAGTNLVTIRTGTDILVNKNIYTSATGGNSVLFFDTSTTPGSTPRILQLTDDLKAPDTAQIKYRFINLSPDTGATADLWLVNGSTDSILLASTTFIGRNPAPSSIAAFVAIKYHGDAYTIKVKKAGTAVLYASIISYVFAIKGVYSIIFSGLPAGTGGQGPALSVLHHAD
ncbi:MAG: DUF4397 domain-containing protein [Bacteroidota bacterium]